MKRFWMDVTLVERRDGFTVELDRRPMRTPLRRPLVVPTAGLADLVAEEWQAAEDEFDPRSMTATRLANTVVDRLPRLRQAAIDELVGYLRTDLICYRAARPSSLVDRQKEAWDPILAWLEERYDAVLAVTADVAPIEQPQASIERLRKAIERMDDWMLVVLHSAAQSLSSAALALAVIEGRLRPGDAVRASTVDERFEMEQWGWDSEIDRTHRALLREIEGAADVLAALGRSS